MSLLADLLSKVKQSDRKGSVPPNLIRTVAQASELRRLRGKLLWILVMSLVLIVVGFGMVYFVDKRLKPLGSMASSSIGRSGKTPQADSTSAAAARTISPVPADTSPALRAGPEPSASTAPSNRRSDTSDKTKETTGVSGSSSGPTPAGNTPHQGTGETSKEKQSSALSIAGKQSAASENIENILTESGNENRNERDNLLYQAHTCEQKGDFPKAAAYYRKVLDKEPGNYLVMNSLANALIKTNAFREALKYAAAALAIRKDHVPSLINAGIASIGFGNDNEGEMYLTKAKSLVPSNRTVLMNLALLYEKNSRYRDAYALFRQLAESGETQGRLGMARISEKEGDFREAEKIYRALLAAENVNPAARQQAGERLGIIENKR